MDSHDDVELLLDAGLDRRIVGSDEVEIAAPALATEPIVIDAGARLLDGTRVRFTARVRAVEYALVIKALSYRW